MSHDTRMNEAWHKWMIFTRMHKLCMKPLGRLSLTNTRTHTLSFSPSLSLALSRARSLSLLLSSSLSHARSLSLFASHSLSPSLFNPPLCVCTRAGRFLFFGINSPRTKYFPTFFYGYKKLQMCHWLNVSSDSFICVTWFIHICDMTHSYVWHDSFICVIWLIRMRVMTQPYVWHGSFVCVSWLIHICDMSHW